MMSDNNHTVYSSDDVNGPPSRQPYDPNMNHNSEHRWNIVTDESNFESKQTSNRQNKHTTHVTTTNHNGSSGGGKRCANTLSNNDFINWSVGQVMNSFDVSDFTKAFQTVTLINLASSCLVSFNRVVYLDLISTLAIFWFNLDPAATVYNPSTGAVAVSSRWQRNSSYLYPISGIIV